MDPLLLVAESLWWALPVAAGVGAAGYRAVTTNRRRARRLELDAARHEERSAIQTLLAARADARAAKSEVLAAKARRDSPRALAEARRRAADSRDLEWSASLNLRAARSRVHAARMQYHARTADTQLPIEVLIARHDAVTARWLEYETDPVKALTYPQMLDAQHPATLAFLRAQRDAHQLRPGATRERITPAAFLAYRDAVATEEAAFDAAERDALGLPRESAPGPSWIPTNVTLPSWVPRAAELLRTVADVASTIPAQPAPGKTDPQTASRPPWPAPAWRSAPPPQR